MNVFVPPLVGFNKNLSLLDIVSMFFRVLNQMEGDLCVLFLRLGSLRAV